MRGAPRSRKGSMQLSIEAIIILVIAFVLLGLAIVFVKQFFGQATSSTQTVLTQVASACNTATADNPITPTQFEIKQGGTAEEDICILNNADSAILFGNIQLESCVRPDGSTATTTGANADITVLSAPLPQEQRGESKVFKTTFNIGKNAALGTYICNVAMAPQNPPAGSTNIVGPVQVTVEVQ